MADPDFTFSVLCEFRARLIASEADGRVFSTLLARFRKRGLIKERGWQRTDSTHVLAVIHRLNRLECVGETLRHALNRLTDADPEWVQRKRATKSWGYQAAIFMAVTGLWL